MNFVRRAKNWPAFDLNKPCIQFLFVLVAFLYGGLHCLAWNSVFPSYVQQLLWRISSAIIMATGIPALVCYFSLEVVESDQYFSLYCWRWRKYLIVASKALFKDGLVRIGYTRLLTPIGYLLRGVVIILLPTYVFGRIYLVVECFIQLFHLQPKPIFVQPSWSTYFPHLG
jgi:hypothetical protein